MLRVIYAVNQIDGQMFRFEQSVPSDIGRIAANNEMRFKCEIDSRDVHVHTCL